MLSTLWFDAHSPILLDGKLTGREFEDHGYVNIVLPNL